MKMRLRLRRSPGSWSPVRRPRPAPRHSWPAGHRGSRSPEPRTWSPTRSGPRRPVSRSSATGTARSSRSRVVRGPLGVPAITFDGSLARGHLREGPPGGARLLDLRRRASDARSSSSTRGRSRPLRTVVLRGIVRLRRGVARRQQALPARVPGRRPGRRALRRPLGRPPHREARARRDRRQDRAGRADERDRARSCLEQATARGPTRSTTAGRRTRSSTRSTRGRAPRAASTCRGRVRPSRSSTA